MSDWRAGASNDCVSELNAPMTRMCQTAIRSVCASSHSRIAEPIMIALVTMSTRRRSSRSAVTPPTNANSSRGIAWLTPSRPR